MLHLQWIKVSKDPLSRILASGLTDSFQGNFYKNYKVIINFYRMKMGLGNFQGSTWNGILKIKPAYSFSSLLVEICFTFLEIIQNFEIFYIRV